MVDFLEQLTGIAGLILDPHFWGGGCTRSSGAATRSTRSTGSEELLLDWRLNLIVHLNEDWDQGLGRRPRALGPDMTAPERVVPVANRCVIFNMTDFSLHGHPDPLDCPPDRTRRSMALYYYSNGRPLSELSKSRTTDSGRGPARSSAASPGPRRSTRRHRAGAAGQEGPRQGPLAQALTGTGPADRTQPIGGSLIGGQPSTHSDRRFPQLRPRGRRGLVVGVARGPPDPADDRRRTPAGPPRRTGQAWPASAAAGPDLVDQGPCPGRAGSPCRPQTTPPPRARARPGQIRGRSRARWPRRRSASSPYMKKRRRSPEALPHLPAGQQEAP
jgi:hypothetical protein